MLFREGRVGLGVQGIYIYMFGVKKEEKEKAACLGWLVSS